jgi:predicted exporter
MRHRFLFSVVLVVWVLCIGVNIHYALFLSSFSDERLHEYLLGTVDGAALSILAMLLLLKLRWG